MTQKEQARAQGAVPEGRRLILAAEDILEYFGTRTERGEKLTAEWGEPDEHGWYTPTFTVHYDDVPAQSEDRAEPGLRADSLRAALEPRKRDWIDCEANAAHNVSYDLIARLLARAALGASAGLDVERLSIAMNRAYTFGTGTAEEVAAEYARLSVPSEPVE
jgi:hypothetical protein